ncbi:MAG: DUF4351 domain-containing protein [Planctomycetota bacterium]
MSEGRAEGHLAGERSILVRQLRKRFSDLPAEVEQRVAAATAAELELWGDRILDAQALDQVFAPPA